MKRVKRQRNIVNKVEFTAKIESNIELSGLDQDFLVSVNNVLMQVYVNEKTNLHGIEQLKRNHYLHFSGCVKPSTSRKVEDVDEFIIECDNMYYTATRDNFFNYEDMLAGKAV